MTRTDHNAHPWRRAARLVTITAAAFGLFVTACGGATAELPAPTATAAKATVAPATVAPTVAPTTAATTAPVAATTVNVEALANGDNILLKADQIAVAAGNVTFNFKNSDKMQHELWVYPIQDVTKLMAAKRANQDVDEEEFLKDIAGHDEDIDPGKTDSFTATLKPGFYELACWKTMASADGKSAVVHFDKGQVLTLAVTGAGGPAASISTASSAISVAMKDGAYNSWVLIPDHLVATAGKVTVSVTNNMKVNHDFVVYPIGDVSDDIAKGLKAGEDIDLDQAQPIAEDLEPGKSASKDITLTPGTSVMACFMVSKDASGAAFLHRDMGQRITFVVK